MIVTGTNSETYKSTHIKHIVGQVTETLEANKELLVNGTNTLIVTGANTETYKSSVHKHLVGNVTETHIANKLLNVNGTNTLIVTGANTETYKSSVTKHIEENITETHDGNKTLYVNGTSSTTINGIRTHIVTGITRETLYDTKTLVINSNSTETINGSKSVYINDNNDYILQASKDINLDAANNINLKQGKINIENTTQSTSTTNGSLIISGGVGIAKNVNIGQNLNVSNNLIIGNNLEVNGIIVKGSMEVEGATTNSNPILQQGSTSNTNKDTGIKLIQNNRTAFIGLEHSSNEFVIIPDSVTNNDLVTGSIGTLRANIKNGSFNGTTITANGVTTLNDKLTVNSSVDIGKNLNISGNLNVLGNINQINSVQINVDDKNIVLASGTTNDDEIGDGGLILNGTTQKKFTWNATTGWTSSEDITIIDPKKFTVGIGTTTIDSSDIKLGKSITETNELQLNSALVDINAGSNGLYLDTEGILNLNSSNNVINIGNNDVDKNINMGTNGQRTITMGSSNSTKLDIDSKIIELDATSGGISLDATDSSNFTTTNGTLTLEGNTGININENNSTIISINDDRDIKTTNTRKIELDCSDILEINSSGGAISIGNDAVSQNIEIGTGGSSRSINIGNNTGSTGINILSGTNGISLNSTGVGDITINSSDTLLLDSVGVLSLNSSNGEINIGNNNISKSINIGSDGDRTINIGNTNLNDINIITSSNNKTYISNDLDSTSKTTGSLVVNGGVGINNNLNVGGTLNVQGLINKYISGYLDGLIRGNILFNNICFTNTTHSDTNGNSIIEFDNNSPQTILALENYQPPSGATQVDITLNFTIYDENITSEFLLELLINDSSPNNSHKYEQKYKMFSTNQTNVYSKTFYLTLSDITNWNTNKSIKFKFSTGENKKYLFISDLADDTNYKTTNVQLPSIEISPQFF